MPVYKNNLKQLYAENNIVGKNVWMIPALEIVSVKFLSANNGQTYSNNSLAIADELFECDWPFCEVGN